ncbi:MAG: glycosyltransferase [Micromonosporaceae bacterium]
MRQENRAAVIIPAHNEDATVGAVVSASREAALVGEVVVVDDGSTDDTAATAVASGARVVANAQRGKGEAMLTGARATDAEVLVFLDADLTGLRPDHVDRLARPVLDGSVAMTVGLFDRGPLLNPVFLWLLPRLAGERAMRRELLLTLHPRDTRGYRMEAALNSHVVHRGGRVRPFVLDGMFHRTKEQKESVALVGLVRKVGMLSVAMWEYLAYQLRAAARTLVRRSARSTTSRDRARERSAGPARRARTR